MRVTLDVPETMKHYVDFADSGYQFKVKELMMFELIRQGKLSFGKAAELLGIPKMRLITDLGQFGLPYFDMPAGEVLEDATAARKVAEGGA